MSARRRPPRPPSEDYEVGYGKAPPAGRFKKGRSGNPLGRPRGRHGEVPYQAVLGQLVTIKEGGELRRVGAAEAFLMYLAKSGLAGDVSAGRAALVALEGARARQSHNAAPMSMVIVAVSPGKVGCQLRSLGMAVKVDRFRSSARILIEPWLVEAALGRLGDLQLTRTEQVIVRSATRTPGKVNWPDWWEER